MTGLTLALVLAQAAPLDVRWNAVTQPAPGPAQAIGTYANGCLQGAVPLPPGGRGFEVMRPSRRRFYAHPQLAAFVERFGSEVKRRHLPRLLVGDASQPRGGPTPSGHRSHQTGLDVDIAFARPDAVARRPLSASERERLSVPAVVDLASGKFTAAWTPEVPRLLALAASDPAVDRIFVNPAIKRELCSTAKGEPWLARLRPWWGHHDHFHVRLRCPDGDLLCERQEPTGGSAAPDAGVATEDDGCGPTLAWWWSDDARTTQQRRAVPVAPPPMPPACATLVPDAGAVAGAAKPLPKTAPAARAAGLR